MITLKTLPQATAQEVFDQITQHLLKQGKAARLGTGACRYRVETQGEILKCAAGCLIADDEYAEDSLEGRSWGLLVSNRTVPKKHCELIKSLQNVHDTCFMHEWPMQFERLARCYKLQYNPPQQS